MCWNNIYSSYLDHVNLPPEHIPYYFNAFGSVAKACLTDPECPFKNYAEREACWGYESECNQSQAYHVRPRCPGEHRGWVKSKEAQYSTFYTQADFGT